jgi:predicted amidohydrolase
MQQFRVSAVAMQNWVGQLERSLAQIAHWAGRAKAQDADLVVFPELSLTGYLTAPLIHRYAESIPGPATERLQTIAAEAGLLICAGLVERDQGRYYNTQVIVSGDGVIGAQRKIHVPAHERPYWEGGDTISVFDLGPARVGIAVCRDSFFSEYQATLFHRDAELVIMPFGYPTVPRGRYLVDTIHGMSMQYHCWAYGLYGVLCNSAGDRGSSEAEPRGMSFPGWAGVIGPWGEVLEFTRDDGNDEAMVTATLTPDGLLDRRRHPNFIAGDLRPAVYAEAAELRKA